MSIQSIRAETATAASAVSARGPEAAGPAAMPSVASADARTLAIQRAPEVRLDAQTASQQETQIDQALDEVRKAIAPVAQELMFSVDNDTGRTVIKVIDSSTNEVIKQIPSEEILAIAKALDRLQGLLVRQEV